jgi:hypothetical protein
MKHLLPWELMGYILTYVGRINYVIKGNGESGVYFDRSSAVPHTTNIFITCINSKKQLACPLTSPSSPSTLIAHTSHLPKDTGGSPCPYFVD